MYLQYLKWLRVLWYSTGVFTSCWNPTNKIIMEEQSKMMQVRFFKLAFWNLRLQTLTVDDISEWQIQILKFLIGMHYAISNFNLEKTY